MEVRYANEDVRAAAKEKGVRFWQLAEKLGVSDTTLAKLFRHELPDNKKAQLMKIIDELALDNGSTEELF